MSFSEELLLPSMGIIYQRKDFDGIVKVKQFTTKNYKDLLTGNASTAALTAFVSGCIEDCPVKVKDMNQNDVLAILFKTRAMTLGNILKTQVKCPSCKHVEDVNWDLNNVEINYLGVEQYPIPVILPVSNKEIKVRFPTGADAAKAKNVAEKRSSKFNRDSDELQKIYTIVSLIDVDNMDLIEKSDWYDTLPPQDAIYINEVFNEMSDVFGVKLTRETVCSSCDYSFNTYIDIGSDFFRPYNNVNLGITSKTGDLRGPIKKSDISE
jgi:hypothetical protein